ncbi:MAG TPA: hypothetical protein VJT49_01105 [Amycolatopsis sp.]|uniref:hypothetical protein n=1 Tax=Amycolatopsis sp. TaxID=37632 RepID=UPI002B48089A|nr:hypothetical protein [Amycolatopsis sp.]HKS43713.1 hypothetical protein [Amycolatopsis sp.]
MTKTENPHTEAMLKLADAMFRGALWPAVGAAALGVVVSAVLAGLPGLFGALAGGAIGFASCLATLWMMRKTAAMHPMAVMAVALGGYIVKLLVLLGVLTALRGVDALQPKALALTMLAVILASAAAEAVAFRRTKIPTIVPASGDSD